jgi:hypothetical protein
MDGLRVTDTNSSNDTKGRAFGLEGNDYVYVIVGFVVALGLYLLMTALFSAGKLAALLLVMPFLLVPLAWVFLLRRNKPEGYAEDWLDHHLAGEGWSFVSQVQPQPPRGRP